MADCKLYQLRVSLTDSEPLIWRRILVPAMLTLDELHRVLQITMGWQDLANYHYRVGKRRSDTESALLAMPLHEIISDDLTVFTYVYDPRDGWFHTVEVEMVLPADPEGHYPHCISGEKACPPEGCGGIWGYDDFLDGLEDTNNPDNPNSWDELRHTFDPDVFNIDLVNVQLHS